MRYRSVLVEHVDSLRLSMREVMARHPFQIDAIVIVPDHLHALWTMPVRDCDCPYSSIHHYIATGVMDSSWGADVQIRDEYSFGER